MKKRSDCVFGLHFDFHANPQACPGPIGATLREEDIREICRLIRPDFLQIDCKGHPGWASYPTACGNAMPAFAGDPLETWRRVTREEGVNLYMHYSGVIDEKYASEHPEDAVLQPDGQRSKNVTRTMGRYVDNLVIPQFKELARKYGVNGVWVDGDCWGSQADFDPETIAAFEKETGLKLDGRIPAKRGDKYFEEYREFCRELFRRYVRRYVNALHASDPGFEVASNWSYTDHMPEPVSADVDFISGDLSPWDSFNSARYAGRAIAQQEKTWDLMSWNFRFYNENGVSWHVPKHPVQIMQEAASVIALGGGFQNYITQYPDGAPRMEEIRPMARVAEFVRERAPYCFRGKAVPQVALLLSTYDRHRESDNLYSRNGMEKIMGMTSLLCDAGHSTQIVSEHTLRAHSYDYPVIVVPETFAGLETETVHELLAYAERGGSLVLIGARTCALFDAADAPIHVEEKVAKSGCFTLDGVSFGSASDYCPLSAANGETIARVGETYRSPSSPVCAVAPCGKGMIACVGFDLGSAYMRGAQYLHRTLIEAVLDRLYRPIARVESAEGLLEVVCLEKDGRLMIQLVNANGAHRDRSVATEDMIPPCRDVELTLRLEKAPKALTLRPEGRDLPFTVEDGEVRVKIDKVPIHEIIEVR